MKKINKIIIGVVGGMTLFANKGQVTSAQVTRYGTAVSPTSTVRVNYQDAGLIRINNNLQPSAKPTATPTLTPSSKPTATPTPILSTKPTATPTPKPTAKPTLKPTPKPTAKPTPKSTAKASQGVAGILQSIQTNISNFFAGIFGKFGK